MNKEQIDFIKRFNHLSPMTIEELFDYLKDNDLLSEKGKKFKTDFWQLFIKEDE